MIEMDKTKQFQFVEPRKKFEKYETLNLIIWTVFLKF